jgi:hypothetical protein
MKKLLLAFAFCLGWSLAMLPLAASPAAAADFSNWAVMIVAGDHHSHSGAPSQVFDNARRDLAKAFAGIGFKPNNMVEFSPDPDKEAQPLDLSSMANGLWDVSNRAPAGCLIYYTSHGTPTGVVMDNTVLTPETFSHVVNNACGAKPAVIVMSACFSGQFVPALGGGNRMVMTAARPDRTSFGCGDDDHYTFFDGCFLQQMPGSSSFRELALKTQECVGKLEAQMGVDAPSEPMIAYGKQIGEALAWK